MLERTRQVLIRATALALPVYALAEVNYPRLQPQTQLAVFALLGLALCFLVRRDEGDAGTARTLLDFALALAAAAVCAYVAVQNEPVFSSLWSNATSLGDRAGAETRLDVVVGVVGTLVVLEATRRAIGWVLPLLALTFIAYAWFGASLPDWLLPHRGYDLERIVSLGFVHSQGVFGIALRVMFTYVFLFVIFGALLEMSGATGFIVEAARRLFARSTGGAAKVAVMSSGLMGSLSGSAVANTATTGTFTIPMMRSAGFSPRVAAGVEAAASSGGALMPPVMGAGAYMMLEIIDPAVTYLEIIRAALIPAILFYLSLFAIVHLTARRLAVDSTDEAASEVDAAVESFRWLGFEGVIFLAGLGGLVVFLLSGFSVFRSVTLALGLVVVLAFVHPRTRPGWKQLEAALLKASRGSVALVSAAACVGIVIGMVTLTGAGTRLPAMILPLAQESLLAALFAIMLSSIVLGMGLPSVVCYLLMATLVGPVLGQLGVVPLAAHLFIFYFGMMSMVTPPVALAAYAASSISGSSFLPTSTAAFRFALVGFLLPFMFVLRPELLMLDDSGSVANAGRVAAAVAVAVVGILAFAGGIAGHLRRNLGTASRTVLFAAAALALVPAKGAQLGGLGISWWNLAGVALVAGVVTLVGRQRALP